MEFVAKILEKNDTSLLEEFYINSSNQTDLGINLKLDQSPNIWNSFAVLGHNTRVLAVIEKNNKHIACACVISLKECYIQGVLYTVGYMSGLKVRHEYRGSFALASFTKLFNSYWKEVKAVCWLSSVFIDNKVLNNLLSSRRLLLPEVEIITSYNTYLFKPESIQFSSLGKVEIDIRIANQDYLKSITTFLQQEYKKRDFIADYSLKEIADGVGLLKGFSLQNLVLALKNGEVIGMLGLWDQSDYRRWYIESYSIKYKLLKPLLNIAAKLTKMPKLPKAGELINYKMLSLLLIENDNVDIFKLLYQEIAKQTSKKDLISIGLVGHHPLNKLFGKNCIKLQNNIYIGYWKEYTELKRSIRKSNIYIEQGGL